MLIIERLTKQHDRKSFDCGNQKLNYFLQKIARQHAERNISRTFVLIDNDLPATILGYYTLVLCEVMPSTITDPRLQHYPHPIPAAKLARLAVCINNQGGGLGKLLLLNAMERFINVLEDTGLVGMFVDAKNAAASAYYLRYGFVPVTDDSLLLYLPAKTIQQVLSR